MSDSETTAPVAEHPYDVAILGGGLAGLTLALQLKKAVPACTVLVIEKQAHPVPEAAHKVGESTVELATRYLLNLGLAEHLQTAQLKKFGLRFFFSTADNLDITHRVELGLTAFHSVPTFQLDRGRLENTLGEEVRKLDIPFLDASKVEQIELDATNLHTLHIRRPDGAQTIQARWVVDASGRSSLLKRQLGLAEKGPHRANAVWFRIGQKIDIDEWSDSPAWHARITDGERYLSTNHLCGKGYWVWLIPLASGSTSVGIVTDPSLHAFDTMNRFDRALNWLRQYEPQCASVIEHSQASIQDFRVMKDYSYGCRQVYSSDRWCLTGEAGLFIDPLYSPGSDYIAISNGLITDLISHDLAGEDIRTLARGHNLIYLSMARAGFTIYEQQYGLLGNGQVMVAKYIWDVAAYWSGFSLLYFHDKIRTLAENRFRSVLLHRLSQLATRMQTFFREWDAIDQTIVTDLFVDHYHPLPFMQTFHDRLKATFTDEEFDEEFTQNIHLLELIAGRIASKVITAYSSSSEPAIQAQLTAWQTDPLLNKWSARYTREAATHPINDDWIYLATPQRTQAEAIHS